jgi:hypothetical protein
LDFFIFMLALHWRKVLLFLPVIAVFGYLRSCFGG